MSRTPDGRATIRAVRIRAPLRVDGRLDEAVYAEVPPITDFIQNDPKPGEVATEKTDMWVLFDDQRVYIVARCWETHPERIVANELRRDSTVTFGGNDNFVVDLDTFHDRRNGVVFGVNPIGGRNDGQALNGQQYNGDFNPIWTFQVGRFEGGWTAEMAIPFKSLRFKPGREQVWGLMAVRQSKWKNEVSFITKMAPGRGHRGILETSLGANLVGIEAPTTVRNIEIKPFAVADVTTDRLARPPQSNNTGADVGLDVKYGVTRNLTADLTYKTDFAQVEADEQQVNLTRFSLFFPEKRDFFLENQGTFSFGGVATAGANAGTGDAPILFYSRRIGLEGGLAVPVRGGGRLTGRVGRFSLGALNIQSDDAPERGVRASNFTVLRLKRDILRKSSVGVMLTSRSALQPGLGRNEAFGADASMGFFDNMFLYAFAAKARTATATPGDDTSHRVQLDYPGDRYAVQVERLAVGSRFDPGVGFVRRSGVTKHYGQFKFTPRTKRFTRIRKFQYIGSVSHIENTVAKRTDTRAVDGEFGIELQNSDRVFGAYVSTYEYLPQPFRIATGVTLPVGGYDYAIGRVGYNFGRQRRVSGNVLLEGGTFYDGDRLTLAVSAGRYSPLARLSAEPTVSINRVHLPAGDFTTTLLGSRVTYTITPWAFLSALVQYNSGTRTVSTNARLRWEYRPGSEFFVVYNEQRDTQGLGGPDLQNRALIVKVNRSMRF
ncbi:MAG: DUF5916 domain-containing protein [Vicinamibacterales bacterium]